MQLVTDIDATLLQSIAISAKRAPAPLVSIMAAVDLTYGALAAEFKLTDALQRLSSHGLIAAHVDENDSTSFGLRLTAAGEAIIAAQPRKAASAEIRLERLKDSLYAHNGSGEDEPLDIPIEQVRAAIAEHRAAKRIPAVNMLMPKAPLTPEEQQKRQWRKGFSSKAANRGPAKRSSGPQSSGNKGPGRGAGRGAR
jgi:DNA-binding MarR family transcriptional regulator